MKILLGLYQGALGTRTLLELLGYKQKTGNYKAAMESLLNSKLIEMTIPDKPNSRLQKYRLTAKGKAALAARRK